MRPHKIAICIWVTITLLGIICFFTPIGGWHIGKWNLRWPTLSEILDGETPIDSLANDSTWLAEQNDSIVLADSLFLLPDSLLPTDTTGVDSIVIPQDLDPHYYLTAFYNALDSASMMQIRIIHYGDSQIEEDRITNVLRELWQAQYGGGGVGLIPLHQTIPTSSVRQWISINGGVQSTQGGPKRYLCYGPGSMRMKGDDYGVMGQAAAMNNALVGGSQSIIMNTAPFSKKLKSYNYYNQLRILADGITVSFRKPETGVTDSLVSGTGIFQLPDSTTEYKIHLKGKGYVYGISLETPTGVIVDNIPMRGCSGTIFTRIDSLMLSNFYRESNTRLIILQYGGNMIPNTKTIKGLNGYIESLRQQVRYLRACAPQASILFIGPSDMSTRINGVMTTYPMVPRMDEALAQMAKEEQIAYWSMYKAMGGHGSMVSWRRQGLAANDYVHFAKSGATKVARLLHEWFQWTPDSLPKQSADSTLVDSVVIGDTIIISDTTQIQQTSTTVDTTQIL